MLAAASGIQHRKICEEPGQLLWLGAHTSKPGTHAAQLNLTNSIMASTAMTHTQAVCKHHTRLYEGRTSHCAFSYGSW